MSEDGSEDSPSRPKRKIKKVMVLSSDSSSDSDDGVATMGTRRKRLRVIDQANMYNNGRSTEYKYNLSVFQVLSDDGSDSSGSSVVCAGARRKRALPKLRDSESDSGSSAWASDHSDAANHGTSAAKPASGFASDSSEGNSDKCSICLLRFTNQEVGTPQSCEHIFCLDCITEWSKNVNTCPVDRMTFDYIVVRACAGGRVLRNEPVKVIERRPSIEMLVIEDPTVCEVCRRTDSEETMLLCDGCDLGYHMACLTPPLQEVPISQWLCPNCDDLLSDVDTLFSGISDMDMALEASLRDMPRHVPMRTRSSRYSRSLSVSEEPSTSSGRRENHLNSENIPTTSRGSSTSQSTRTRSVTTRRKPTTQRRRHKRRRTKTVIIEYEVQENGKFPVTKRVKRKIKKRKSKRRQPRTAARRSHVRASVRARLAHAHAHAHAGTAAPHAHAAHADLAELRRRAGAPALSLFGDPNQLDYFSEDDEHGISETASTAVAVRPTSSILSAYRQARRKMISVPSPPQAASAPDVLSSILESQTLLHSKKSIISIAVDGSVNIKVETRENTKLPKSTAQGKNPTEERVDLSKSEDTSKKVPSYPGQSRGGGGWGGGYRYHREQNTNNFNSRGGNYENNYGGGGYQNRQGNSYHQQHNNMRGDDGDTYNNYSRRQPQYPPGDDLNFERNRRQPMDQNRGPNIANQRLGEQQQGRYSLASSWRPYVPPAPSPRVEPPPQHRHSFGGFDNPLDMRVGQIARQNSTNDADVNFSQIRKPYLPLPEPPVFRFDKTTEVEKSEDEKSDPDLVIDTEKYDPTEPTNDDDSAEEDTSVALAPPPTAAAPMPPLVAPIPPLAAPMPLLGTPMPPLAASIPSLAAPMPPLAAPPLPTEPVPDLPPEQHAVQNIIAGLDTSAMNVPPNVLDCAVRAVLKEHRNLIVPTLAPQHELSDEDSEGDCPNFSIYSATSVHIANNENADELSPETETPAPSIQDNLEDLVQEDDDPPPDEHSSATSAPFPSPAPLSFRLETNILKKKTEEELKEKVSKRCPITTNPRNPIKIKLNTPSLIKRPMNLYDEEDEEMEEDIEPAIEPSNERVVSLKQNSEDTIEKETIPLGTDSKIVAEEEEEEKEEAHEEDKAMECINEVDRENTSPEVDEAPCTPAPVATSETSEKTDHSDEEDGEEDRQRAATPIDNDKSGNDTGSEDDNDDLSGTEENDVPLDQQSPAKESIERNEENLEKMTESISETEDERSYTPCLDENKSKDTSLETEKEKGIEGLDTEMISEDEGNEIFSDTERAQSDRVSPPPAPVVDGEEGEIVDKKKEGQETKKKKKKDSKKEGKEKGKGKSKKGEIAFKKLSKSGKERNYRERDKDKEKNKRERRDSSEGGERERNKRRKERRKDLERYDVRTLVSEKRRRPKDAFGRDVSPRTAPRSASREPSARREPSPRATPPRRRASSSPRRPRATPSPRGPSPRAASPARRRRRRSADKRAEPRRRRSVERARKRRRSGSGSRSPRPKLAKRKKRARDSRSGSRRRSPRRRSPRRRRVRRASRTPSRAPSPLPEPVTRSPGSVDSRLLSPRTPPPEPSPPPPEPSPRARRRRDPERVRHRRARDLAGPSKEVFTSGDNILVSVSFKDQERVSGDERRERRRERRRRRRRAAAPDPDAVAAKPVAIIDLERSPFRELTPSPRNVIVLLSDEEAPHAVETSSAGPAAAAAAPEAVGPKTPPEPPAPPPAAAGAEEARGPLTPPEPPESPDAYDPYEPTRSASASPASRASARAASPPRALMTLEAAQKTNLSADDVIDRRPLSPIEKVMALLQSTRDVAPEAPPPGEAAAAGAAPACEAPAALPAPSAAPAPAAAAGPAPPVRMVLPSPTRAAPPKLFLAKPSPIKSDPIKPMPAAKLARAAPVRRSPAPEGESPYSPGSSDFGDLFEPPGAPGRDAFDAILERPVRTRKQRSAAAKVPVKFNRKKGKTQVGVKIDEDNLKILDDLPSSAVEMQVKSKFLKKLNRQERVVEEVKLVLKPHYNKKHVTKDEYKDILRRTVPKICHNKSGEINPAKIQALVEAYVKKFRKKHKLGLV